MTDSTRSSEPELSALADDFDVVGEMSVGGRTPFLIATRKSPTGKRQQDSSRVLIEIARPPEGDESHALDHLASDTKLLSNLRHRRLVSILDGRWLGDDAFAVVREYVDDPSAADLLARGEPFTNTRTAAILREVHGVLQWAREQDVVHRRVTPDRLFLEPTTDRVRVSFAVGPVQRIRTIDAATEDVVTVVRLAIAMLTAGLRPEETEGRSFAELRPDLPARLFEETARLLVEPASDAELTLYLALIGMADPVAEGETERDRIRAEVLEEQRVEREKLAKQRADVARLEAEERRKLAEEGEELRGAFAQEKSKLEREFAAAQRLLAAERAEMQRIIAAERAELLAKREALEKEVATRFAAIERAAASDRASLDALREKILEAAEDELEKRRAEALEDLDDSDIRLDTGSYRTPRFVPPKLSSLPGIAFRRDEHLAKAAPIGEPTVPSEPWSVVEVVRKLRAPRRRPIRWRRWAVRGGIAAAILITAGAAVVIESRYPGFSDTPSASTPAPRVVRAAGTTPPPVAAPSTEVAAPTYTNESGVVATPLSADSVAAKARRDSVRRANPTGLITRIGPPDSALQRPALAPGVRRQPGTRRDDQDLMDLSDSLSGSDAGNTPGPQEPSTNPP
jgi:hypothetical protein